MRVDFGKKLQNYPKETLIQTVDYIMHDANKK